MTVDQARERLWTCRIDNDGREFNHPDVIWDHLVRAYRRTLATDRPILNIVIREWLKSDDEHDRAWGISLTSEFGIRENRDLVETLWRHTKARGGPQAVGKRERLRKLLDRLSD